MTHAEIVAETKAIMRESNASTYDVGLFSPTYYTPITTPAPAVPTTK